MLHKNKANSLFSLSGGEGVLQEIGILQCLLRRDPLGGVHGEELLELKVQTDKRRGFRTSFKETTQSVFKEPF